MKYSILPRIGLSILLLVLATTCFAETPREYYYAIEQDGSICGYAHVVIAPTEVEGRTYLLLSDSLWMNFTALGKQIEGKYLFTFTIDPSTGQYIRHTSLIDQGQTKLGAEMIYHNDSMTIIGQPGNDTSVVAVPSGTLLQNTRLHAHVLDYFVNDNLTEKECQVFSEIDGELNTVVFKNLGREKIVLNDTSYDAVKFETLNKNIGIQFVMWVDPTDGLLLKMEHPVRSVYLADASIKDKVGRADLDNKIFARVGTIIPNAWAVSHMKVQASLQPAGMWATPETLNVPGQSFEGTVVDNKINGVFDIHHVRYDGSNAPPFPCDFSGVDSLQEYLQPSDLIESDEEVLIAKAKELTDGATNAWDAMTKLSTWVNKEIGYDLPGGVTALKTYEMRLGECGSHSNLLSAFCRAVGIPARGVFGCMYVPDHGGAFGQHAWNEVYMGDAGWIPVDCTVEEISYVDCGHIRLGVWSSNAAMLNPDTMSIIEFAVGEGSYADLAAPSGLDYDAYIGKYQGPGNVFTVLTQDNHLAIDIPGQMVFALKDPDDNGDWFFALTARASVSFSQDSDGTVTMLTINSRQRFPRDAAADGLAEVADLPESHRLIVGSYTVPMQGVSFIVKSEAGELSLIFPGNTSLPLKEDPANNRWLADTGKSTLDIRFDANDSGQIQAMSFSELVDCAKIP
ncbi:MAG: transglutaminase-like domain-containing protein [Candidatus Zixiibacteriota bacterium]